MHIDIFAPYLRCLKAGLIQNRTTSSTFDDDIVITVDFIDNTREYPEKNELIVMENKISVVLGFIGKI